MSETEKQPIFGAPGGAKSGEGAPSQAPMYYDSTQSPRAVSYTFVNLKMDVPSFETRWLYLVLSLL